MIRLIVEKELISIIKSEFKNFSFICNLILNNELYSDISYINIKDTDKITYITEISLIKIKNKFNISNVNDAFHVHGNTLKRQEMKIGKFIMKIISENIKVEKLKNQINLEKFIDHYKAVIHNIFNEDIANNINIVQGKDIIRWYFYENYDKDRKLGDNLHDSCMRYGRCSDYFDIYVNNPDVCKLLILYKDGDRNLIKARALLWELPNGIKYLDRIYYNANIYKLSITKYAKDNGWAIYDERNDLPKINISINKCEFYPYVDTFKYLNEENGVLSITNIKDENTKYSLTSQYGDPIKLH